VATLFWCIEFPRRANHSSPFSNELNLKRNFGLLRWIATKAYVYCCYKTVTKRVPTWPMFSGFSNKHALIKLFGF
jgi:hypothetical protein